MDNSCKPVVKAPPLLMLAGLVIIIAGMKAAEPILVPFLLAALIAVICAPPLFWLQRKGVPKVLAIVLILAAILFAGFLFGMIIGPSLSNFLRSLPGYQDRLSAYVSSVIGWLNERGINISANDVIHSLTGGIMSLAGGILSALSNILEDMLLILFTVMFILLEAADFPKKLRYLLKEPEKSLARIGEFSRNATRYLEIKTITSAGIGLVVWLWLLIIGLDYPVLWGTLSFLLNYIPNIGAIIAAFPIVLFALIQMGLGYALLIVAGFTITHIIIGFIVEPRLIGQGLSLSTLVVFLSLVFWGWIWGPIGMIISVPMTIIVKIAMESNENTRGFAVLLGSDARD